MILPLDGLVTYGFCRLYISLSPLILPLASTCLSLLLSIRNPFSIYNATTETSETDHHELCFYFIEKTLAIV